MRGEDVGLGLVPGIGDLVAQRHELERGVARRRAQALDLGGGVGGGDPARRGEGGPPELRPAAADDARRRRNGRDPGRTARRSRCEPPSPVDRGPDDDRRRVAPGHGGHLRPRRPAGCHRPRDGAREGCRRRTTGQEVRRGARRPRRPCSPRRRSAASAWQAPDRSATSAPSGPRLTRTRSAPAGDELGRRVSHVTERRQRASDDLFELRTVRLEERDRCPDDGAQCAPVGIDGHRGPWRKAGGERGVEWVRQARWQRPAADDPESAAVEAAAPTADAAPAAAAGLAPGASGGLEAADEGLLPRSTTLEEAPSPRVRSASAPAR